MQILLNNMYHGAVQSLFFVCLFVLAAYGAGSLVNVYILKTKINNLIAEVLVETVLGLNLLALLTLIMGVCKLLNPSSIWTISIIFASSAVCLRIPPLIKAKVEFFRDNTYFSILLIIIAVFTLGSALCLPYVWDELTYHITLPYRWIGDGSLAVFEDNGFSGFPALPEILFRFGCEEGGILFPRLLVWISYLLLFSSIYIYIKPYSSRFVAFFVTFMFIANPLIINMMRSTYVEVFIILSMLACLLLVRESEISRKTIFLCGIIAGGAVAVKLTGVGAAAVVFIFLYSKYHDSRKLRKSSIFIYFTLGGIIMALPFYLRPWILTGNPFYPVLSSIFGGSEAERLVSQYWYLAGSAHFGLRSILGYFTLPILIAIDGKAFDGMTLGWVFIVFMLLCAWWLRCKSAEDKNFWKKNMYLPVSMLVYYTFWFMSSQQTRFLQPLFFLVLLGAVHGMSCFNLKQQKIIAAILTVVWLVGFIYPPISGQSIGSPDWLAVKHFQLSWRSLKYFPGKSLEFLKFAVRDPGYIESMEAIAENTPENAKVMLLYERRGLYCPRQYVIGTPYLQAMYNTPVPSSANEFYASLKNGEIDYVLLGGTVKNPDEIGGEYLAKKEQLMKQISHLVRTGRINVIWGRDDYFLCRVL